MLSWVMLSKAFLKSTAAIHRGVCHSSAVSCSNEITNKLSTVLLPGLKPAWSLLCWESRVGSS
eukprot:3527670-Pyramimonas_sp.AAC.1